jgi:putative SOS response-associated peptidase YedK
MCGRFSQAMTPKEMGDLFDAEPVEELAPARAGLNRWNVAPTDTVAAVVERDGRRIVGPFRWGLVPVWATDRREGARMINARAERLESSPAFRSSFERQRCIVPADGFFEWRRAEGRALPFFIRRRDRRPMALAGIWSSWRDQATGQRMPSCSIVTCKPNALLAELHDRMPVMLPATAWATWLDAGAGPDHLHGLLTAAPEDELELFPVSARVNSVRNDGPDLVEPLGAADILGRGLGR